jgi:serine/threonine-protein kinase HipA
MVRNGDAHLKNFGVLYDYPGALVRLAPVYDIVTTTAYIPRDVPALSLAGTKKWWPRKMVEKFAVAHLAVPIGRVSQIMEEIADAVIDTRVLLLAYMDEYQEFRDVGERMLTAWDTGVTSTLS